MFEALGYEISRNRYAYLKELFRVHAFDHLVDVGANRGQFLSLSRSAGYLGPATAIEPIAEYKEEIETNGNVRVFSNALGKIRETAGLNLYSSSDFSSLHKLNDRYGREYNNAPMISEQRLIDVLTLDELNVPGTNILLKVDAQGGDADVLRGAIKTLERVSVLFLELPFLRIYDGGCTAAQLLSLTEASDFAPSKFFANSITKYGAWVDGDVAFVKVPKDRVAD